MFNRLRQELNSAPKFQPIDNMRENYEVPPVWKVVDEENYDLNGQGSGNNVLVVIAQLIDRISGAGLVGTEDDWSIAFNKLKEDLRRSSKTDEGRRMIVKFHMLSLSVTTEEEYRTMVRMVWKQTQLLLGNGEQKLSLFLMGLGTVNDCVSKSESASSDEWIAKIYPWLSSQLCGRGADVNAVKKKKATTTDTCPVNDRWEHFFATQSLHGF